jgi:hypothetical protein
MKIDLGLIRFDLSQGEPLLPMVATFVGVNDEQQRLKGLPTMAKHKPMAFRRTLSIGFSICLEGETEAMALERTVQEVIKRVNATIAGSTNVSRPGLVGALTTLQYKQGVTPLRTFIFVGCANRWLVSAALASLDTPDSLDGAREQIMAFISSIELGAPFSAPKG